MTLIINMHATWQLISGHPDWKKIYMNVLRVSPYILYVPKVLTAPKAPKVLKELKVPKAPKELKVPKAPKELKELKALKVLKALKYLRKPNYYTKGDPMGLLSYYMYIGK